MFELKQSSKSVKISAIKICSILLALVITASFFVTPVTAEIVRGTNTVYYATDLVESRGSGTSASVTTEPKINLEGSNWIFGVASIQDSFNPTTAGFKAPEVKGVTGGVLVSWVAPENTNGTAAIKVIGDSFSKVYTAVSNPAKIDLPAGKYDIQVSVDSKHSAITTYKQIVHSASNVTNNYGQMANTAEVGLGNFNAYVELGSSANYISADAALLIRIDREIVENKEIVNYYDTQNSKFVSFDDDSAKIDKYTMADAHIAYNFALKTASKNQQGDYVQGSSFAFNNESYKSVYAIDIDNQLLNEVASSQKNNDFAYPFASARYSNGVGKGDIYLIVPLSNYSADTLNSVKSTGLFNFAISNLRYVKPAGQLNTSGNKDISNLKYGNFDSSAENAANEISVLYDSNLVFSEVGIIPNYENFLNSDFDAEAKQVNVLSSANCANAATLTTLTPDTTVTNDFSVKISDSSVNSYYDFHTQGAKQNELVAIGIDYITSVGEKMRFGFTAPNEGNYEISAPIHANAEDGVQYRVIKETVAGDKLILQETKEYASTDERFCLINTNLAQGDKIYLEAWAEKDTVINFGVPACIKKASQQVYDSREYLTPNLIADDSDVQSATLDSNATWTFGYFNMPFTYNDGSTDVVVNSGTLYSNIFTAYNNIGFLNSTAKITNNDGLGIGALTVGSKATSLYSALNKFDAYRGRSADNFTYFQPHILALNSNNSLQTYGNNTNYIGVLSLPKLYTNSTSFRIGLGNSYCGNTNSQKMAFNIGIYYQFAAVQNGKASLTVPQVSDTESKIIVLHNDTVKKIYDGTVAEADAVLNIEDIKAGDKISICFAKIGVDGYDTTDGYTSLISFKNSPKVEFVSTENKVEVSFSGAESKLVNAGDSVVMPYASKEKAIFKGWKEASSEDVIAAGEELSNVQSNLSFTPVFHLYGDANLDGTAFDAADLVDLREDLLGIESVLDADCVNLNQDDGLNICDLVRLYKGSAGEAIDIGF